MADHVSEQFEVRTPAGFTLRGEAAGDGPVLVCLHGLTATRRYVLQGSSRLARDGRRVVSYDARGHGTSDPGPSYAYADLVDDLGAVLDDRGIETCALAGSSMGAHTALAFALAAPDRVDALVVITPAFDGSTDHPMDAWDARAAATTEGDLDRFVELTGATDLPESVRDTAVKAVRQRMERHEHLDAVGHALREVPRSAPLRSLDDLEGIDVPALVVGSRDAADPEHPLAVARDYAERLPHAELTVEDEGDSPLAWRGSQLSRAIGGFLAGYS